MILDFGKPVLLTDVIIPLCGDLASLSIDVWVQGEEVDGQRLVVASDIGVRSLVMNNIMPPAVCRYLKVISCLECCLRKLMSVLNSLAFNHNC